ncbi:MAG: efflux RND transporter periplasmic adaptor subunit [Saprospiraceae bacterium]
MDRPISNTAQQKQIASKIFKGFIFLAAVIGCFFLLRKVLTTKATKKDFSIAQVEKGLIENVITASGLVIPSFEQQINAPINTEIKAIHLKSGTEVKPGDLIMDLDEEFIRLEYESLKDQLEVQKNNMSRLGLSYDKDLNDLDYDNQIKALQIARMEAQLSDVKRLKAIGGATQEEVEEATLNLKIAKLEKNKLGNELNFRKKVVTNDRRNLELEVLIQEKKQAELKRKLRETSVAAPRAGVITWVNENIGRKVKEGEALVRMANLENFRVEASCSDRYGSQLKLGMLVKVRIDDQDLQGKISAILPAIENNTLEFVIELVNANHASLRPNMRVEVAVIVNQKNNVLKVKNGAAFSGAINQEVFVVQGDQAIRKNVQLGLINSDYVEIVGGDLKAGDQILISDTKLYNHLESIQLK